MIAGVDGCEDGWLAACESADGAIELRFIERVADLFDDARLRLLLIDIPIGLMERSPRGADQAARRLLKGRSSCVFNAPIRPILEARSYSEANRIWREIEGKGCSAQGFALVPKVVEVDQLVRDKASGRLRIVEGHPEVSFALLNAGAAILESKHSKEGSRIRSELLSPEFDRDIHSLVASWPKSMRTDVLDSLALLWSARRIERGVAVRVPDTVVERDRFGIEAVIQA